MRIRQLTEAIHNQYLALDDHTPVRLYAAVSPEQMAAVIHNSLTSNKGKEHTGSEVYHTEYVYVSPSFQEAARSGDVVFMFYTTGQYLEPLRPRPGAARELKQKYPESKYPDTTHSLVTGVKAAKYYGILTKNDVNSLALTGYDEEGNHAKGGVPMSIENFNRWYVNVYQNKYGTKGSTSKVATDWDAIQQTVAAKKQTYDQRMAAQRKAELERKRNSPWRRFFKR